MESSEIEITESDVYAYLCKQEYEKFIRYFHRLLEKKKFIRAYHHLKIIEAMQMVVEGKTRKLIINVPPRYGKTTTAVWYFLAYAFAINPKSKFIHLSYSAELALDNSDKAREIIKSAEYRQLYPFVKIRRETDSKSKWYTVNGGGVYATSAAGQVTGFGAGEVEKEEDEIEDFELINELEGFFVNEDHAKFAGALIIDDPIKPEDADSETIRKRINARWDSTIQNRVNSRNTPIIIIMQRLHEDDLCGHVLKTDGVYSETNPNGWKVLTLPAILDQGTSQERALWELKHTLQELKAMQMKTPVVFGRQYQQNPTPVAGLLYKQFKTYRELPTHAVTIKAFIDTADTGADFLCAIVYAVTPLGCYLIDVYYTDQPQEVTEPETALFLTSNNVSIVKVESNNGGRAFARNIERIMRENKNFRTTVNWFHQSANKEARINSNAATVQNMILYPEDWETRWPSFAQHVKSFLAKGKNATDDPEDCLTGIVETEYGSVGKKPRRAN